MIYLTDYRITQPGIIETFDDVVFPQKCHWFPESYSRVATGVFYAPHRVAEKVLDPELCKRLRETKQNQTAFILASGNAHFAGINPRSSKKTRLTYEYKFLPFTLTQVYAGRTAQALGANDLIMTDASACASSLKVLMDVQTLINQHGFDRVVVLAIEDQVNNSVLEFFGEAQASLLLKDEQTGIKPSAFDEVNYGFHIGQGACLAVFEKNPQVEPIACLLGAYTASEDHGNAIGQREDGQGFVRAMQGAMRIANVLPAEVKIVKTHGTGTKSNNVAEKAALTSTLKDFVATGYKQTYGHTMGVSGLLETCALLDDMMKGEIPAIPNRTSDDSVFLSKPHPTVHGKIMSLAAGMGNIYSAAVLSTEV